MYLRRLWSITLLTCMAGIAAGCHNTTEALPPQDEEEENLSLQTRNLTLTKVVEGLQLPIYLTAPTGDTRRLFVVERFGLIKTVKDGVVLPEPFLDLTSNIATNGDERGMLGMAFHPNFATNGYVYVSYTALNGDVTIMRYTVEGDKAKVATAKEILRVPHPDRNHNGGMLGFGPDGKLYASFGDGGSGGDPERDSQNLMTLLGKLIRIDVDGGDPYAVPTDNPWYGRTNARGEIWALGLRNPWRWSIDAPSARLYIADVGQNLYEEVNVASLSRKSVNYGWPTMEGTHCFSPSVGCEQTGLTIPVIEYEHTTLCRSVIGGFVYRGTLVPEHQGRYFYGDYCLGWIRSFKYGNNANNGDSGKIVEHVDWRVSETDKIMSFGRDGRGELYVLFSSGGISRIGAAVP